MRNPNRSTAVATRQFFQWLEESFGGNLPMDTKAPILSSFQTLQLSHLQQLFAHQALAIHVKEFYPKASAKELAQELLRDQQQLSNWKVSTARGLENSDVWTLGTTPLNMAVSQGNLSEYYQDQVPNEFQKRRRQRISTTDDGTKSKTQQDIAKPIWPLDQLRLELDQLWPQGAGLARNPDDLSLCKSGGLTRITKGPTRWKKGFIHVDEMAPLNVTKGYFSANIYLQLPQGHENDSILEIWPLDIRTKWDWYKNAHTLSALASQDAEGQLVLRKALGEPIRLHAEPGDLILLCVQRPHAAIGFATPKSHRVSLQCFLEFVGDQQRLSIEA